MIKKDFLITKENKVLLAYRGSAANVFIPKEVEKIASKAFARSRKIVKISVPDKVTVIGNSAFEKCTSLMSVTMPNGVKELGIGLFKGCSNLMSFAFPEGVTEIPDYAFVGCRKLDKLEIPENIKKIGKQAFKDCISLKSIVMISSTPPEIEEDALCDSLESISVPGEALDAYRESWKKYESLIVENLSLAFRMQRGE